MELNVQKCRQIFGEIYGEDNQVLEKQYQRYQKLGEKFEDTFLNRDVHFFSAPGRTEIGGNHTDHNHGRVLAASVNLDLIAAVAISDSNVVILYSEGYSQPFIVDLITLSVVEEEKGTTSALIRGIAARFKQLNYKIGGFNAYITSDVLPGSGLSSSASIEILIGSIFNYFFNDNKIAPEEIAIIGQYAENEYFGKPCGLMDQMTCAVGGIVTIDFKHPHQPVAEKVDFDFASQNYRLLVVDTGGTHADLTEDYASVPTEMKAVAKVLGAEVVRDLEFDHFMFNIRELRSKVGDRAVLRALHFFGDNARVLEQVDALKKGDFERFLALVNQSGESSFKWLQNIYTTRNVSEQGVSLGLALTEQYLKEIGAGACRVHGGGFAGTIQVFLPESAVDHYIQRIEYVFGKDAALVLKVRSRGAMHVDVA